MPRLGVIGTIVWDRIYARDGRQVPIEEWGGISYALAALSAARPPDWEIVPILKIGQDLDVHAREFLRTFPGLDLEAGLKTVPEPNNRVELRYYDSERRTERLSGGVPAWTWPELQPILESVDALYVNFISGFELDLETAIRMRLGFHGPIYADLHSLFLGVTPAGYRTLRPLEAWRDWLRCFDIAQVNEDELGCLADAWGDPWRFAAEVVTEDLKLLFVTLGERGAAYVASPAYRPDPLSWHRRGIAEAPPLAVPGAATSELIASDREVVDGDPTGCGDVWGSTCFLNLLTGASLGDAMRRANRAAARNAEHRGATGLDLFLQGKIAT